MQKESACFERVYACYNKRELVSPDPLQFLYCFPKKKDRESAALLCACFAYGNVKQIIKNLAYLFSLMPQGPYAFITGQTPAQIRRALAGVRYRFTSAQECTAFLLAVRRILGRYGSLENCFLAGYRPQDETVLPALRAFAGQLRSGGAIPSLVPDPEKNSALKRLNLFLRWMVRRDEVDPGGWTRIAPAKLLVPLDTHMHRLALQLGLTRRRTADINTALDITRTLAKICPEDPVKFDFALTRFGIREDMNYQDLKLFLSQSRSTKKS